MKRKLIVLILILITGLYMSESETFAASTNCIGETQDNEFTVRAGDKIIKKYRTYNGKRQYRRWNTVKKCWIDKNWIDL